ncbi:hypothetical protein ElyMa_002365900 [Elysia marginata]|uniref:Uncharacterized protein n=1 Tax=Elysia marginata TaxID=1093978 RepID=A0AAV4GBZ9_9GAST|nr:hypothetical protein ElyMa_002365900 [Elysia marginata]
MLYGISLSCRPVGQGERHARPTHLTCSSDQALALTGSQGDKKLQVINWLHIWLAQEMCKRHVIIHRGDKYSKQTGRDNLVMFECCTHAVTFQT